MSAAPATRVMAAPLSRSNWNPPGDLRFVGVSGGARMR